MDGGLVVGVVVPFGDKGAFGFVGLGLFEGGAEFGLAFGVLGLVAFLGCQLYEIGQVHVLLEPEELFVFLFFFGFGDEFAQLYLQLFHVWVRGEVPVFLGRALKR